MIAAGSITVPRSPRGPTTVAGVTGPGSSLEGVSPSVTYYNGSSASGMALSKHPSSAGTYTVIASFVGSADYTATSADDNLHDWQGDADGPGE